MAPLYVPLPSTLVQDVRPRFALCDINLQPAYTDDIPFDLSSSRITPHPTSDVLISFGNSR